MKYTLIVFFLLATGRGYCQVKPSALGGDVCPCDIMYAIDGLPINTATYRTMSLQEYDIVKVVPPAINVYGTIRHGTDGEPCPDSTWSCTKITTRTFWLINGKLYKTRRQKNKAVFDFGFLSFKFIDKRDSTLGKRRRTILRFKLDRLFY